MRGVFLHRVQARVRFVHPRVTILRSEERMVSTFFSLAAIDKYPAGARYVRKQVSNRLDILRRICASKTLTIKQ